MFSGLNPLITAVSALLPGLVIGYLVRHLVASRKVTLAESKAEATLADSKAKSQDIILEAKNNAFKILEEAKKEEKERNSQLSRIENLLTRKESELDQKGKELSSEKETLKHKAVELTALKGELEQSREKQLKELERISGLDREKAKIELVAKTEEEYRDDLYKRMRKLENENREELEKKAREIVTTAIQRYSSSQIADAMTTVVSLPSDEVKGKIIGKEGRNIKAIERLTGVDIIIDDTPEALVVSG
ncbi:MAG: Rnase Y domain-containing protein, partial [bacterium]|nr:Rnase Y domain-containing protein [bacterium]